MALFFSWNHTSVRNNDDIIKTRTNNEEVTDMCKCISKTVLLLAICLAAGLCNPLPGTVMRTYASGAVKESSAKVPVEEMLDALDNDTYRTVYKALKAGEVIKNGSRGNVAKGVQQTLIALGQDIAADGAVGPKTLGALNAVQKAFGLKKTDTLDADGYAKLLPGLLIMEDEDAAYDLLSGPMGGEYDYLRGGALVLQKKFYSAKKAFSSSKHGDWESRAKNCVQSWPKTGQLYSNPAVKGSNTELCIKFNTDSKTAMLVKIYTAKGTLARTLFIGGSGQATASLPAGTYIIKDGIGKNWYGEKESFGQRPEGQYETMTFDNGQQEIGLRKNYRSTITINVKEADPDAKGVGTEYEDWENF